MFHGKLIERMRHHRTATAARVYLSAAWNGKSTPSCWKVISISL